MDLQCCICDKLLKPIEAFGPIHFPACYPHYARFEARLEEVAINGRWKLHETSEKILVMRGELSMTSKVAEKISELERDVEDMEMERVALLDMAGDLDWDIGRMRTKIIKAGLKEPTNEI